MGASLPINLRCDHTGKLGSTMTKGQALWIVIPTLCVFGLALAGFYILKFSGAPSRKRRSTPAR